MLPGSSISSSVSHFSDRCHCKRINKEIHNRINKQFSRAVNEVNAKQENNGFYFKKSFPNSSQINELNSYPNYSLTIGPKDKSKIFCYKKFSFHLGTFPAYENEKEIVEANIDLDSMPDFEEVYLKWVDKLSREIKYFNYQKNLILDTKEKINQTFIEAIKDLRILNQDGYYYCPISINDYNDPFAEPKVKHFLHEMDFQPLQDYELWKVSIKEHHRGFEFGINHFPPKIYEYIYEVIDSESYKTSPVSIGSFRIMDEPEFHEILQSNNTQSYFINIFKRNFHNMKNLVEKENQKEREKEKEKKTLIKIYRLFSKSI